MATYFLLSGFYFSGRENKMSAIAPEEKDGFFFYNHSIYLFFLPLPFLPHSLKSTPYEDSHTTFLGRVSFLTTFDFTSLETGQNHRIPF